MQLRPGSRRAAW